MNELSNERLRQSFVRRAAKAYDVQEVEAFVQKWSESCLDYCQNQKKPHVSASGNHSDRRLSLVRPNSCGAKSGESSEKL